MNITDSGEHSNTPLVVLIGSFRTFVLKEGQDYTTFVRYPESFHSLNATLPDFGAARILSESLT